MSDEARVAAEALARRLFTNNRDEHAARLVLLLPDGRDGGGWGEAIVASMIAGALDRFHADQSDALRSELQRLVDEMPK
jgi:hypothetical protein